MKTIIIPDIHLKIERADQILSSEDWDQAVLQGDLFDDFGDTAVQNQIAATWLKGLLYDPRFTVLWGNHDQHYLLDNPYWICSGYSKAKHDAILEVGIDPTRLKLATVVDGGWLISHAGFHSHYLEMHKDVGPITASEIARLEMLDGKVPQLCQIGRDRGGKGIIGGITWLDYGSFVPHPEYRQIFGHTPAAKPRGGWAGNWCIDTHLHHYALITDGHLEIKESK